MAYHQRNAFRDRSNEKRQTSYETYRPFGRYDERIEEEERPKVKIDRYVHRCVYCGLRHESDQFKLPTGWKNTEKGVVCSECGDGLSELLVEEC